MKNLTKALETAWEFRKMCAGRTNTTTSSPHSYHDVLDTEEKLAKLHPPVLTAHPEIDCRNRAAAEELLGGTMPVRLMGTQIYHAPGMISPCPGSGAHPL